MRAYCCTRAVQAVWQRTGMAGCVGGALRSALRVGIFYQTLRKADRDFLALEYLTHFDVPYIDEARASLTCESKRTRNSYHVVSRYSIMRSAMLVRRGQPRAWQVGSRPIADTEAVATCGARAARAASARAVEVERERAIHNNSAGSSADHFC